VKGEKGAEEEAEEEIEGREEAVGNSEAEEIEETGLKVTDPKGKELKVKKEEKSPKEKDHIEVVEDTEETAKAAIVEEEKVPTEVVETVKEEVIVVEVKADPIEVVEAMEKGVVTEAEVRVVTEVTVRAVTEEEAEPAEAEAKALPLNTKKEEHRNERPQLFLSELISTTIEK